MNVSKYIEKLKELDACNDACNEALKYSLQFETSQEAWDNCERGDWMLWLIGKLSGKSESDKRKKLVTITCKCVRLSLVYVQKGELRPLKAIETVEKWARGDATIKEVKISAADADAYAAAYTAAYTAYTADAADAAAYAADAAAYTAYAAAYAAAYTGYADYAAAYAAGYAGDAAAYTGYADYAAAYAAGYAGDFDRTARDKTLLKCADIVRQAYPNVDDLLKRK